MSYDNSYQKINRLDRHAGAARINSMQSERLFLNNLYETLQRELEKVKSRINLIDEQIEAERKYVNQQNK
jgi:hypothetical protein